MFLIKKQNPKTTTTKNPQTTKHLLHMLGVLVGLVHTMKASLIHPFLRERHGGPWQSSSVTTVPRGIL